MQGWGGRLAELARCSLRPPRGVERNAGRLGECQAPGSKQARPRVLASLGVQPSSRGPLACPRAWLLIICCGPSGAGPLQSSSRTPHIQCPLLAPPSLVPPAPATKSLTAGLRSRLLLPELLVAELSDMPGCRTAASIAKGLPQRASLFYLRPVYILDEGWAKRRVSCVAFWLWRLWEPKRTQ